MRLATLVSGGKDSLYAAYLAMKEHEVKYLITLFPEKEDSWMFHHPCIELTKLQAETLGIKQIVRKTKGEKEKELEDLKETLMSIRNEIDGVVSGAVYSEYQKRRIEKICKQLKLKSITPLWHRDPEKLLREEIESGFEIIITGVAAEGFNKNWLGRKINLDTIEDLKKLNKRFGTSLTGEGGEFESLVLDCPLFKKRIKLLDFKTVWDSKTNSGHIVVKNARLVNK